MREGELLNREYGFESKQGPRWNGKTSFETTIPELKQISNFLFLEAICIGVSVVILSLGVVIFFLSYGYERSDLEAIITAVISLVCVLGVMVFADLKINKLTSVVNQMFTEAILSNIGMRPIDHASIAQKKSGYIHLTDGFDVSMWEIFYYSDREDVVSMEKFSESAYNKYLEDGTIKFATKPEDRLKASA